MADQGGGNAGDIEEQLSDTAAAAAPKNSDHKNPDNNDGDVSSSKGSLSKCPKLLTLVTTIISRFLFSVVKMVLLSLMAALGLPFIFVYIFITGDTTSLYYDGYAAGHSDKEDDKKEGRYIAMKKKAIRVKIHRLTILTGVRMGCLVLLWMVINLRVANLRGVTLLGSLLWKWYLLVALILLAYPILMYLLDKMSLVIIDGLSMSYRGSNVEYFMDGIGQSLILALYFTSLLLAWLLCVDTTDAQLHRYGTLTLVSFLVGGVLSLLKSSVLLWWRTKLIYNKYKGQILSAGCKFFFNLLLMDQKYGSDILVSWMDWRNYTPQEFVPEDQKPKEVEDLDRKGRRPNRRKVLPIEDYLLKKGASLRNVHDVATFLTNNFVLSLTEDDDIPDIVPYLRRKFRSNQGPEYNIRATKYEYSTVEDLEEVFLREVLQLETSKENPTYADFEKWMVDGLKYCYAVGNRIDGAFEVMRILSRVMTTFIVVVVTLIWLYITGLATTKVVVGLASIFLGLSFVFGDACKTFFQGVIFSFVTHPFDVGDRCIIDDKELKVKKINILTTTFFGSQSKETVLCPNSDLAAKRITLLHGERESERKVEAEPATDLTDLVEFGLPPKTTSAQIESLQGSIERHMEGGFESGVYKNSYYVSFMESGDSIKMSVNFEHVLSGGMHPKAIEMWKKKQRSKLFLQLKKLVEDTGNDVSPP